MMDRESEQEDALMRRAAERIGPDILLALGGGAARGVSHVGVLRELERAGFRVRGVAGTSIGSIVGAAFCAGRLDACETFLRKLNWRRLFKLLDPVVPRSGVFAGKHLIKRCEELIGDLDFAELETPFIAVATDLHTGEEVHLARGRLAHAVRASSGIPGFFDPYPESRVLGEEARAAKERWLVDGFVASPVPVLAARTLGDWPIVAVDVNAPFDERVVGVSESASKRSKAEARRPSMLESLYSSSTMLQHNLAQAQYLDVEPALVLEPNMTGVKMFQFIIGDDLIAEGARCTRRALVAAGGELGDPL